MIVPISSRFVVVMRVDGKKGVYCIDGTTAMPCLVPWPEFVRRWSGHLLALIEHGPSRMVLGAAFCGVGALAGAAVDLLVRHRGYLLGATRCLLKHILQHMFVYFVGVAALETPAISAPYVPNMERIAKAHQARFEGIRTIRADYHREMAPLISLEKLYEIKGTYEMAPSELIIVQTDDGRAYKSIKSHRHRLTDINNFLEKHMKSGREAARGRHTFRQVSDAIKRLSATPFEALLVFDGKRLIERSPYPLFPLGVETTIYSVIHVPRLGSSYFTIPPLSYDLWAFRVPALPEDDKSRRKNRIPDLFETGEFTVAPKLVRVGDDECVLIASPKNQSLWLLPDKGFALRKRTTYINGHKRLDMEFGDWKAVKKGAWIAGTIVGTTYGVQGFHPPQYEGKPLTRTIYRMTKLDVNSPSNESFFHVDFHPGDAIVDETLVADDRKGKVEVDEAGQRMVPTVSYEVPADPGALDRAVANAVAMDRWRQAHRSWLGSPFLWINIALVAAIVTFIAIRRFRRT